MKQRGKTILSLLLSLVMLLGLFPGMSMTAYAASINAFGGQSVTISSDQTCTSFDVLDGSTLTVNQGVTLTLNMNDGHSFILFDNSNLELHGTLAGSVGSGATWMDNTYINVYLSDGAKYTVTGLSCMDGDNYLRYYGYDAATDGNGTVSVKNGDADVTSSSVGYKTTSYTFTATPSSGYKFKNWTKGPGGEVLGTDASINVTCEQNGQYQVYANFEQAAAAVTGVSLNKTSTTLTVGATETLTATVLPDNAADKTVAWASKNPDIARVSEGVVTAVAPGTVEIFATATNGTDDTADNRTATCIVTVTAAPPVITLSDFSETYDGSPKKLISSVVYSGTEDLYLRVDCLTTYKNKISWAKYTGPSDLTNVFAPTNAGTYCVYYFVGTPDNPEGGTRVDGQTRIDKALPKSDNFTFTAPSSLNYDGTAKTATVTIKDGVIGMGEVTVRYYSDADRYNEVAECKNPGTYYVGIDVDNGENYNSDERVYDWYDDSWKFTIASPHTHSFTYSASASGDTITATCTEGCPDSYDTTPATLTIVAPALTVYGGTGSAEATVTGSIDGVTTPAVVYKKGADTLPAAPTDAGTYTANITLGDATASVTYTIEKADPGTPTVTMSGYTYGGAVSTPSIGTYSGGGTVTYYYNTSNSTTGGTEWTGITATSLNANTYYMYAVIAPTNNFNGYTTATADFTIAKATVTVTAEAKSKTYGEADPALTYTSSGLVGSDALTGALTRETGENAGTYAIGQGTLTAGDNYTISYTGANFTINKAAITITADDKSSKYGDDLAALTYTIGGAYKDGDELGVTLNTTATKTSDVGEYPITVSWNENANYTATVTSGKYTITKTGLTVTATGYTGAYDGAAHGITVDVGSSGATVYYAAEALTAENYTTAGSTALTYIDAGEYTVYFYVVSGNYDPDTVSGSKTVIITRATGTATDAQKPTAKTDLVADNTDQALVTAPAALPEGYTKVQYSLDGETWTDTVPTGKDAGSYTVNYKYVGDKNHNDFQGEPFTVTIRTLTVSFEVSGGSAVAAQSVVKGEKVVRPADPSKSGNAFDGWFQDATFAKTFDFETPITADVTLYAKWTPNDYTLTTITGTTSDANHVWYKDSNVTVVLTVKLATEPDNSFAHYVRTEIDGTPVAATAREGSTVVTLAPADLQRLSVGAHTVSIVFDNGRVDTRLTVRQPSKTPATGDQSHTALYLAALTVSVLGMAALTAENKKRRSAKH